MVLETSFDEIKLNYRYQPKKKKFESLYFVTVVKSLKESFMHSCYKFFKDGLFKNFVNKWFKKYDDNKNI